MNFLIIVYCSFLFIMYCTNGYSLLVEILAEGDGSGLRRIWSSVILASCEYKCIKEIENLVQHPSNNISIIARVGVNIPLL